MTQNLLEPSGDALFQLRVRQAILAAQLSTKQVGLLIIDFEKIECPLTNLRSLDDQFSEKIWLRLRSALRDSDTVVRLEGGAMAVLLPSINGPEDGVLVANKILSKLQEPLLIEGLEVDLRPRVGIALFPEHSTDACALMQRADLALTTAKQTQSNYALYSQEHSDVQRPPLRMSELRQAIVADQLFLVYQPKVNLENGTVTGLEVLTRWHHPELGLISPDEFIPVAERTGLIIPLTLWVLHRSLLQCRAWNEMGIDVGVAVNLSMWNLDAPELPDQIAGLLRNTGVSPRKLELEITESAIMDDPPRAMRTLSLIKDLGVSFTIDDFGTGYSSLAHLKKLPVAGMKIDKSFVQNMERDRDNSVIVRSIVDLGHNLGLKVIAEGVESREAGEMLRRFQCDEAQGYYYSRPIPAPEIIGFFKEPPATIIEHTLLAEDLLRIDTHPFNGTSRSSIRPKL